MNNLTVKLIAKVSEGGDLDSTEIATLEKIVNDYENGTLHIFIGDNPMQSEEDIIQGLGQYFFESQL